MRLFFVVGLTCLAGIAAAAERRQRPNVVLFLVDDLGYGDLAAHGNPHVKTPHVDKFLRDGVEFPRFYVSPVCHPTRASLLTGRYTARTFQKVSYHMDPAEVTVAETLQRPATRPACLGNGIWAKGRTNAPAPAGFR